MLLELASQEVGVGGFAAETVPVLCQYRVYVPGGHEVPHAVHTGPLQAGAALPGIYYLLEDLVPFTSSVLP